MKILVSGGTGFIGSFLVKELEKEHDVWILSNDIINEGDKVIYGDVSKEETLKGLSDFDVIYHLAGMLGTSELNEIIYQAVMVNIIGTINMLNVAKRCNAKFINITKPNIWLNTYSITKEAGEKFTKLYGKYIPVVSIKWFNVYGPRQSFHCQKAVPYFIKWALNDKDIQIWGNGKQTADFIHAKDAVRATILIANNKSLEGKTIDVGSGKETSVNELARMIKRLANSKSKIVHHPMRDGEDEDTRLSANIDTLDILGFKPQYTLEEGLEETIEYYAKSDSVLDYI